MNPRRRARALSLIDVLIVISMVALLFCCMLPRIVVAEKEADNRIRCQKNLRQLGLALKLYANEQPRSQSYSRTMYAQKTADKPVFYTKQKSESPFAADGPGPNDVTAAIYLLLRTQDITSDVFTCPSTGATPFQPDNGKTVLNYANFESQKNLSYSMQNPYFMQDAITRGAIWNDVISADFAILADMNPGSPEVLTVTPADAAEKLRKANSPNHGFFGQNVLYADGHVAWSVTPFCSLKNDNIYAPASKRFDDQLKPTITTSSYDADDSVLLPTWDKAIPYPKVDDALLAPAKTAGPTTRP